MTLTSSLITVVVALVVSWLLWRQVRPNSQHHRIKTGKNYEDDNSEKIEQSTTEHDSDAEASSEKLINEQLLKHGLFRIDSFNRHTQQEMEPRSIWNQFELSQALPDFPTLCYHLASENNGSLIMLGQCPYIKQPSESTEVDSSTRELVMLILRSYRLSTLPDAVKMHSPSLNITAEAYDDTLILYRPCSAPVLTEQLDLLNGCFVVFEGMANPDDESELLLWQQKWGMSVQAHKASPD